MELVTTTPQSLVWCQRAPHHTLQGWGGTDAPMILANRQVQVPLLHTGRASQSGQWAYGYQAEMPPSSAQLIWKWGCHLPTETF